MSNKAISVYSVALKRQQEEQGDDASNVRNIEKVDSQVAKSPVGEIAKSPSRQLAKSPDSQKSRRRIVRHGFDLYKDQLLSLSKIQFALWRRDEKKPTIRELMLSAIDNYIEKMKSELGEK